MELFNDPDNPDSFWIAANTFQTFMDYWIATQQPPEQQPDKQISRGAVQYFHKTVKADATRDDLKALTNKGLDSNGPWLDDYGWWGNAFMTALENAGALGMSPDDIEVAQKSAEDCWQIMNYGWGPRRHAAPRRGSLELQSSEAFLRKELGHEFVVLAVGRAPSCPKAGRQISRSQYRRTEVV
jgi:hypothetical protein